jgi:hypothetical protein
MDKKFLIKKILYLVILPIVVFGISVSLQSLLAQWASPTVDPPGGNTYAPINTGPDEQDKDGSLSIGGGFLVGTDNLAVNSTTGNVGIGTANPQQKLSVSGQGLFTSSNSSYDPGDGAGPAIRVGYNTAGDYGYINANNTSVAAKNLVLQPNANQGNVGIGTISPTTKLFVQTANANEAGISSADNGGARIFTVPELGAGGNNPMSSAGDIGIIYHGGSVDTGSLVIGQWSNSPRGIKINATGNVGIGTANPEHKLHVFTNSADNNIISDVASGDTYDPLFSMRVQGETVWNMGVDTSDGNKLKFAHGGNWNNLPSAGTRLTIDGSTGNVGIGTTNPGKKLEVVGGPIKATDGLIIETRSDAQGNPAGPENGRMWLMTEVTGGTGWLNNGTSLYYNAGNVGIGTANPSNHLTIINSSYPGITIGVDQINNKYAEIHYDSTFDFFSIQGGAWGGTTKSLVLQGGGGNVGIGATTPLYRLDLNGGTFAFGDGNTRTESRSDAGLQGNAGAQSGFYQTVAPAPAANWYPGAASWQHFIDVRHSNPNNNYALQIAGSFFDQELYFRKTNGAPTTGWNKFIYQNSADNVGIGKSPSYKLDVAGNFNIDGSYGYYWGGACWAGACPSDIRLKKNITELKGALEKVSRLRPVNFEYNDPSYGQGTQYGLIAQEVEKIYPELVVTDSSGIKKINYGLELQMNTIQSVKELKAENESLKKDINDLNNQIKEIRRLLEK